MYHSTPDKYNPVCNTKSRLDFNKLRIVFFNKRVRGRWGVNVCPDDWSTGKIKKGPEKNAPEYPFDRGGWGVNNYLGDALMPGS